jgi:hypothetical protein
MLSPPAPNLKTNRIISSTVGFMEPAEILKNINEQIDELRDNFNNLEGSLNRQDFDKASLDQ